jgi:transcriptional regulator with XRE-family HTH domain
MNAVGECIRQARKAKGITLDKLAHKVGCSPQCIGQYERGEREPRYVYMVAIAEALDMPVDAFLRPEQMKKDERQDMNVKPKYTSRLAVQDMRHIRMGYEKLHEALNELQMVYAKDNIIAHMVRTMGAMEDTLFEYVMPAKGRK